MNGAPTRRVLPQKSGKGVPWDFFVLQAARGAVEVPNWTLDAVVLSVGAKLNREWTDVEGEHIDRVLSELPESPLFTLKTLLKDARLPLRTPDKHSEQLDRAACLGSFRPAVDQAILMQDAALRVQRDFSQAGFYGCLESLYSPKDWDATDAVSVAMFLLILRSA